ncbi:MAG: glycosyltransferase family 2 protein [Betaproteobacteria bacterium]
MEKVFVLLPVHNRRQITEKFVECLQRQTHRHWHLILVDDGSTDGTAEAVRSRIDAVSVIRGSGNWWWAGSLQQGLNAVRAIHPDRGDILLITNDDIQFEDDFLQTAAAILRARPRCLLLARAKNPLTGEIAETGIEADFRALTFEVAAEPERINCLSTRGLFLRWADAQVIGGFYPRLLPHYLSDYEWTIRATRRGFKCITVPELYVVNQQTGISGAVDFAAASGPLDILRLGLSKKSRVNPFNWFIFILLAADMRALPGSLTRLFQRIGREVMEQSGHRRRPD